MATIEHYLSQLNPVHTLMPSFFRTDFISFIGKPCIMELIYFNSILSPMLMVSVFEVFRLKF
jgi:hypothetical protein